MSWRRSKFSVQFFLSFNLINFFVFLLSVTIDVRCMINLSAILDNCLNLIFNKYIKMKQIIIMRGKNDYIVTNTCEIKFLKAPLNNPPSRRVYGTFIVVDFFFSSLFHSQRKKKKKPFLNVLCSRFYV